MKHTIKVAPGMSFVIENRATDVSLEVVTAFFNKAISIQPATADAIAAALTISSEAVERATGRADIQRLVTNAEQGGAPLGAPHAP